MMYPFLQFYYLYQINPQKIMELLRYFYHPDHTSTWLSTGLGSSSWITDNNGYTIQYLHYLPDGEDWVDERSTTWNSRYTFTGKEKDTETGYHYFGARYYDSGLSIWLSVDPMSDKYPSMSPYNYCANNPVILVDPDGRYFKFGPTVTREQNAMFFDAVRYLDQKNCGGRYGVLKNSPRAYTIVITTNPKENRYDPKTRTITWCPYYAFLTDNGNILSPATILNHEMAHAALYEAAILNIQKNAEKYGSTVANQMYIEEYNALSDPHPQYDNQSDAKIIPGVETRTGILTGEVKEGQVSREEHNKGTFIPVGSPTSTGYNVDGNQDVNQDVNQ